MKTWKVGTAHGNGDQLRVFHSQRKFFSRDITYVNFLKFCSIKWTKILSSIKSYIKKVLLFLGMLKAQELWTKSGTLCKLGSYLISWSYFSVGTKLLLEIHNARALTGSRFLKMAIRNTFLIAIFPPQYGRKYL